MRLLDQGLAATEWAEIRRAYGWVHQAAHILQNENALSGAEVRRRYSGLLGGMSRAREGVGALQEAIAHFRKVTRSYWPCLFHCYDVADLPRTNNDLEQMFGAARYHERRASGRKAASPSLVVRGPVRIPASVATRIRTYSGKEIAPRDQADWRELRAKIQVRADTRTQRTRFRRNPKTYLQQLEHQLLKGVLPS